MKLTYKHLLFAIALPCGFALAGCAGDATLEPGIPVSVTRGESADGAGLASTLAAFRAVLGEPLNTTPGVTGGRREINWDAVPDAVSNTNTFSGDFFGQTDEALPAGRKRGILFNTPGTGLRVSSNDFVDVDPSYDAQVNAFSPLRTFEPVGANVVDCVFRVPGTNELARIRGFGVVFADVDTNNSASIELFSGTRSLGRFFASKSGPAAGGFSFVGAAAEDAIVDRVRIVSGTAPIGSGVLDVSSGGSADLVFMDDFLYSEPQA